MLTIVQDQNPEINTGTISIYSCLPFHHMYRFVKPPQQVRYITIPLTQRFPSFRASQVM